jgi:glycosyltransferase involved in cell wall biosynthesis
METESLTSEGAFDAVVMLTWSDWRQEPRSNRYHYATRFARRWPVIFVQTTLPEPGAGRVESVEGHDILIVHAGDSHDAQQVSFLHELLRERGIRKPLYWIYNPRFAGFIEQRPGQLHVVHATEDYFGQHDELKFSDQAIIASFKQVLGLTDLVVAVTASVAAGVRDGGRYRGSMIIAENGCDPEHWRSVKVADRAQKVAIFQGGINQRLDYELLRKVAERLPDWRFWLCGDASYAPQPGWSRLKELPNVEWLGYLPADDLPELQAQATVGLIPFLQVSIMRISLPLKAYEYVASGLPVVSIPIDALAEEPGLFHFATTADAFASAIEAAAVKRNDPAWLARAERSADAASYDRRFDSVIEKLRIVAATRARSSRKRNVLVLYDNASTHIATVREHIEAIGRYSVHDVFYLPASGIRAPGAADIDLDLFDVVILHYSIRLSIPDHILPTVAGALERYCGVKIAFIQDEYDTVNMTRSWLERLKFDVLFSCVPIEHADKVYPTARFPWMRVVPTLTGYVPDDASIEIYQRPMHERKLTIAYRGRRLAHLYGDLAQEKLWIGLSVRREAESRGIPVDIEVDDVHRIYGRAWYEFLANSRATLGTESGSNVFDFDGSLKTASEKHGSLPYAEFRDRFLKGREGPIRMNQISPKVFEAIRLKVALVLFEGEYSGVVKPDIHFIPLRKDMSNIDEVFAKLEDLEFLKRLTDRAYADVLGDGRFSYRAFAEHIDAEIERATGLQRSRAQFFSVPALIARRGELTPFPVLPDLQPVSALLPDGLNRADFMALLPYHHEQDACALQIPEQGQGLGGEPLSRLSRLRQRLSRGVGKHSIMTVIGQLWDVTPQPIKGAVRNLLR